MKIFIFKEKRYIVCLKTTIYSLALPNHFGKQTLKELDKAVKHIREMKLMMLKKYKEIFDSIS